MFHRWYTDPTPSLRLSMPPGQHHYKFFLDTDESRPYVDAARPHVVLGPRDYKNILDVPYGGVERVTCGPLADPSEKPAQEWLDTWADQPAAIVADIGAARSRIGFSYDMMPPFNVESVRSCPHHQGYLPENTVYWGKRVGINGRLFEDPDIIHLDRISEVSGRRVLPVHASIIDMKTTTKKKDAPAWPHVVLGPRDYKNILDVPYGGVERVTCGPLADPSEKPAQKWLDTWADQPAAIVADIGAGRSRIGFSYDMMPPFNVESVRYNIPRSYFRDAPAWYHIP
ncbi:hypothetical protein Pelo_7761 [Pelomyxa schiedti]|nr:hypothetical protein Pelo_7761 [Pelomyxa schiedti]